MWPERGGRAPRLRSLLSPNPLALGSPFCSSNAFTASSVDFPWSSPRATDCAPGWPPRNASLCPQLAERSPCGREPFRAVLHGDGRSHVSARSQLCRLPRPRASGLRPRGGSEAALLGPPATCVTAPEVPAQDRTGDTNGPSDSFRRGDRTPRGVRAPDPPGTDGLPPTVCRAGAGWSDVPRFRSFP